MILLLLLTVIQNLEFHLEILYDCLFCRWPHNHITGYTHVTDKKDVHWQVFVSFISTYIPTWYCHYFSQWPKIDNSIRKFCMYVCLLKFQGKWPHTTMSLDKPTSLTKRTCTDRFSSTYIPTWYCHCYSQWSKIKNSIWKFCMFVC